jgi:N4-gp56 family major capsid protein
MNTQTLANHSNENKTFYNKALLKRLTANLLFYKYGQKKPLPKNSGNKINFRKFNSLKPATMPLSEGVTPEGNNLSITKVEATVKQYGDYVVVSDILDTLGIDPVITETSEVLGEQGGLTIDTVVGNVISKTTNVFHAGEVAEENNIVAKANGEDIKKIARNLRKHNVKPFADGYYIGVISPEQAYDLQSDSLWQDVSKYNGGEDIKKGEVGKIHGVKFIESTNLPKVMKYTKTGDTEINSSKTYYEVVEGVYYIVKNPVKDKISTYYEGSEELHCAMIFGQDAYGVVDVENSAEGKPSIIVKQAGSAGTADPLNQRSTIGWKSLFTAVILNDLAICAYETKIS